MSPDVLAQIARFRSTWDAAITPSKVRAALAVVLMMVFGGAHVARLGTPLARGVAVGLVAATVAGVVVWRLLSARRARDARRTILGTVGVADPEHAGATLRALTLADRTRTDTASGSPELANLHLFRMLGRVSLERLSERALVSARWWTAGGLVIAIAAMVAVAFEPIRVVEGLDVLVARDGQAPLALVYVDDVDIVAKPPAYLKEDPERVRLSSATAQPRGSVLTIRGRAVHPGRTLVVTDGAEEVPFVDDGKGAVVAHWTLGGSADLRIAALFGDVYVFQHDVQSVRSIPDEAPIVALKGAPTKIRLLETPNIPLDYKVTDDHGLRQIDLVMKAGDKEERRVLSRPSTDTKVEQGGYELNSRDKFLRQTYFPIEVTIQARDNDEVTGPKWGSSASVIIMPPQVGEPEALRFEALLAARDQLTDLLAARLTRELPPKVVAKAYVDAERTGHDEVERAVSEAIEGTYAGLKLAGPYKKLVRGQIERLAKARDGALAAPGAGMHAKLVEATEEVLLALDAGLSALGNRDTRSVALRLADIADECADALFALRSGGDPARHVALIDATVEVLGGGGAQMLRLGDLGLDLGEIVQNDLRRVDRGRKAGDLRQAELAARDLAARLRKPFPSFGGGGGGVESGGPPSPGDVDPSEADENALRDAQDLDELIRDHAREISDVEQALDDAADPAELEALREEARQRAQELREAVSDLPKQRGAPGSAQEMAADARAQAEAMADALERGSPKDAVAAGEQASASLEQARRQGQGSGDMFEQRAGQRAAEASPEVQEHLDWAKEALESLRRSASERAAEALKQSAEEEGALEGRAGQLAERGESGESPMPEDITQLLRDAQRAMQDAKRSLEQGDGEGGLDHQREAQRLLEMAQGEPDASPQRPEGPEGQEIAQDAKVPDKDSHESPEAFRKRVTEGLSQPGDPRLRDAVKRYAEGLLQ